MAEVRDLQISKRLWNLSRTVVGILDASVEIITNANDAYEKWERMVGQKLERYIKVEVDYQNHSLVVVDHALGMTGEELVRKMGTVGAYTSEEGIRGYMSRGAKDIISVGNITYTAIKSGRLSQVQLTTRQQFITSVVDRPVVADERDMYHIPKNGVHVKVDLLKHIKIPALERMSQISKYYSMRDIFSDPNTNVHVVVRDHLGTEVRNKRMIYEFPPVKAQPLIDTAFVVDGWGEESLTYLQVFELDEPEKVSSISQYRDYGILVATPVAIHANEHFSSAVESHPKFCAIRGRLVCPYLDTLMKNLESEVLDERNISPIIAADRSGLNSNHPFRIDLYRQVSRMLMYVLNKELSKRLDPQNLIDLSDLLESLNVDGLSDFSDDIDQEVIEKQIANVAKFLKKKEDLVRQEKDAKYIFADLEQNDQPPPPPDGEDDDGTNGDNVLADDTESGNGSRGSCQLKILIVDGERFDRSYVYYFVGQVLVVELSTRDVFIQESVEHAGDNMYRIVNDTMFFQACVTYVAQAIGAILLKRSLDKMSANERSTMSRADVESLEANTYFNVLPKLHALLTKSDVFKKLVQNDIE